MTGAAPATAVPAIPAVTGSTSAAAERPRRRRLRFWNLGLPIRMNTALFLSCGTRLSWPGSLALGHGSAVRTHARPAVERIKVTLRSQERMRTGVT
ncbi:exported hypothetical protein [Rhodococcus sp. RD6.2]|nr:exported hypothetical protein [Rhodococcus sp. RD6.2]